LGYTHQQIIQLLVSIPESGSTSYPDVDAAWDGQSYAALIRDNLYAWDASGNLIFQTPANLNGTSKFISFSANGSRLITFSSGRIGVNIYNTAGWSKVRHIETDKIHYAAISPDGRFLAILNQERDSASVWDVDTGEELALLNLEYSGYSIHFNPAGDLLIIPGMGSLEQQDDYSTIGALFDTTPGTNWIPWFRIPERDWLISIAMAIA
jgi:WD40 repeat protein